MGNSRRLRLWVALAPFLLIIALGIRDFGGAFLAQGKLDDAASEATKWGRANGYNEPKLAAVAQSATNLPKITVIPARPCGCTTSAGIMQAECNSICPGGGWSQPYIAVTASMCYGTVFTWPGVSYCSRGISQCTAAGCSSRQVLLSAQSVVPQ